MTPSATATAGAEGLTLADWKRIDAACDQFEADLRADAPNDLEHYLADASGALRARLLHDLLTVELEFRHGRGEHPQFSAYSVRFPELRDVVIVVFAHFEFGNHDIPAQGRPSGADVPGANLGGPTREGFRAAGYEVLSELGRGRLGLVYLARKVALNRRCVLKMVADGESVLARFRAEGVDRLRHLDIVRIDHVGDLNGLPYLELEYLPGGSLSEALDGTPRPAAEAARLVESVARAVAEAHRRGIVHRALKPSNVLLDADGHPKVADFGLPDASEAVASVLFYQAPEQVSNQADIVGTATDIYALGAILYELLTGRPPFKAASLRETVAQIQESDPIPPSRFQPGLPGAIETICLKCLEKSPARRYATAEALAEDLRRFRAGEPILGRLKSLRQRLGKGLRRRSGAMAALAIGLLAGVLPLVGLRHDNARLRDAATTADASFRAARQQRDLALKALEQLARRDQTDPALADLDELAQRAEAGPGDLSRAVAHQRLGAIYRALGRTEPARRQFGLARQLAESLASHDPGDDALLGCLSQTYAGLGELELSSGRAGEATTASRRVVALAETHAAAYPRSAAARRDLLDAYLRVGRTHRAGGAASAAELWFRKARDQAEQWSAASPGDAQAGDLLAGTYESLADIHAQAHDPAAARPLFQAAERLRADRVEAVPDDVRARLELARTQADLARLERDNGQFAPAIDLLRRALDHLLRLDRDGRLDRAHRELIDTLRHEIADAETALHPR